MEKGREEPVKLFEYRVRGFCGRIKVVNADVALVGEVADAIVHVCVSVLKGC